MTGESLGDVYVEVHASTRALPEDIRRGVRESETKNAPDFERAGKTGGRNFGKGFRQGAESETKKFNMPKPQGFLQWTLATGALLESLTPVPRALEGVAASASALIGSVGSASTVTLALADNLSTLISVYATTKVATRGVGDAFKEAAAAEKELATTGKLSLSTYQKLHQTLDALAPSAQSFVKESLALAPAWHKVQQSVQQSFFKGLDKDLAHISTALLPVVSKNLLVTSGLLNRSAHGFSGFVSSAQGSKEINTLLVSMNTQLDHLLPAVGHLAKALLNLWVGSAGPAEDTAKSIERASIAFENWSKKVTSNGEWVRTLDRGKESAKALLDSLVGGGELLHAIFSAGVDSGNSMLRTFGDWEKSQAQFFKTAEGQKDLVRFYTSIGDLGRSAKDVWSVVGPLLSTAHNLLQAIAPDIRAAQETLRPLLSTTTELAKAVSSIPGISGVLGIGLAAVALGRLKGMVTSIRLPGLGGAGSRGGIVSSLASGGIQKVFVVNMPLGGVGGAGLAEDALLLGGGSRKGPKASLLEELRTGGLKGLGSRGLGALKDAKGPLALASLLALPMLTDKLGSFGKDTNAAAGNGLLAGMFNPLAGVAAAGGTYAYKGIAGDNSAKSWLETVGGGAAVGASIGTLIAPGIGTAIGGAIGAVGGPVIKGLKNLFSDGPATVKAIDQLNAQLKLVGDAGKRAHDGLLGVREALAAPAGPNHPGAVHALQGNAGLQKQFQSYNVSLTDQAGVLRSFGPAIDLVQGKERAALAMLEQLKTSSKPLTVEQEQQVRYLTIEAQTLHQLLIQNRQAANEKAAADLKRRTDLAAFASASTDWSRVNLAQLRNATLAYDVMHGKVINTTESVAQEAMKLGLTKPEIQVLMKVLPPSKENSVEAVIAAEKFAAAAQKILLPIIGVWSGVEGTPPKNAKPAPSGFDWLNVFGPKKRATGGNISGPGTGTSDSIPIMASAGEYMIKADSARSIGGGALDYMNQTGKLPLHRAGGGSIYDVQPTVTSKTKKTGNKATTVTTIHEGAIFYAPDSKLAAKMGAVHGVLFSSELAKGILKGEAPAINAARTLGGKIIRALDAQISKAQNKIDTIQSDYSNLKQTTTDSLKDTSGIGQIHSFSGIVRSLTKQNTKTALFSKDLQLLQQKGLNKDIVRELSSQGLSALPGVKALLSGGSSGIAKVNSLQGSITKNAQTAGTKTAIYIDGKSLHDAKMAIIPLQAERKNMVLALQELDTHTPSAAARKKLQQMSGVSITQNFYGPMTGADRNRELAWTLKYATKSGGK